MARITAVIILIVSTGCLTKALRVPVEDHFVQTWAIAERCKAQECDADIQEDLDAMAQQACLLDAIVKGDDGKGCARAAGGDK